MYVCTVTMCNVLLYHISVSYKYISIPATTDSSLVVIVSDTRLSVKLINFEIIRSLEGQQGACCKRLV